MDTERYLRPAIADFLKSRMVFLGGPRQVGKTTLCLQFLQPPLATNQAYLNWDDIKSKSLIRRGELPIAPIIVLDEIHKFKNWRGLVKGFFDIRGKTQKILLTGSARLDHYRRGGDSLLGRYYYLRLHPFTLPELGGHRGDLPALLKFGGFPQPLFSQSEKQWKLWQQERAYRVVQDDIRDLENLREYTRLEILADALADRVASPLSILSLSVDLQVNPRTVEHWVTILERVYYCYRIAPFGAPTIRAVKKEKKLYLWDWSSVPDSGPRFENMVASHLLKYCHFLEDTEGKRMELRFLRDRDGREIDFVVLKNKKPIFGVECKAGEKEASRAIAYFQARTAIPYFYQVHSGQKDYLSARNARVLPFVTFCREAELV